MKIQNIYLYCLFICLYCSPGVHATQNIALGCAVSFDPFPNYPLCTDADDARQVTDGKFAPGGFWTDVETVGWAVASPYHIRIDLGKIRPISGVMYSTAGRANAGVLWPAALAVQVSDDGVNYYYVGDLVALDRLNGPLPKLGDDNINHRFTTDKLRTHGRYVVVSIMAEGDAQAYFDEIEVYSGDDSWLSDKLPGRADGDYRNCIYQVMRGLGNMVKANIKKAIISDEAKSNLYARLDALQNGGEPPLPVYTAGFKAILPMDNYQASILATNGSLLHELGLPPITIWQKHRYTRLGVTDFPAKQGASINIDAMRNEFRADSFLVTNATDKPVISTLKISGVHGAPKPDWLEVSNVPWTDTAMREPVAAALPPAEYKGDGYEITIPAGMTRVVWLTVDTSRLASRNHKGVMTLSSGRNTAIIPIQVRVSKIEMPRPRLSLQVWDYAHHTGLRAIVPGNIDSATRMMQSHFVDTPWANGDAIPYTENPAPESFSILDKWIKRWPDARYYMINAYTQTEFRDVKIGTPEFNTKIGNWAKALEAHMRSLNIDPRKLCILIQDEPMTVAQDEFVAAWARAIKASGAKITIFQDPYWTHPEKNPIQEAITLPDILCPNLDVYLRGKLDTIRYWEKIRQSGHKLWFYQCAGPVRNFDPTVYYRLMAWQAFKAKAEGIGFWSFGDIGGGSSSWNEYTITGVAYAPEFIEDAGVTDSVHWQAVREGIEDYEYLSMLRDATQKCRNQKLKSEANALIEEIVDALTADRYEGSAGKTWKDNPLHAKVDESRIRILRMLEKIK
jgi:hypothetical protein